MFAASHSHSPFRRNTVAGSISSRSNSKVFQLARTATLLVAGCGIALAATLAGSGVAAAAPVVCSSPPVGNSVVVDDQASCGATATGIGQAKALASDSGTAVSVADESGTSTTIATGYGVAQWMAENGVTTIALAGFGSGATAGTDSVKCVGPLSMALNMGTGQFCAFGR